MMTKGHTDLFKFTLSSLKFNFTYLTLEKCVRLVKYFIGGSCCGGKEAKLKAKIVTLFPSKIFSDKLVKLKLLWVVCNCNFHMYINQTYFSASY